MLTRRLNVIPAMEDESNKAEATTAAAASTPAAHKIEEQISPGGVR